ncbi:MAG: TetR/AcrR family transcriptional regulator [Lachnospiraceae bacterium]|jgi:AcrR family transcriptional regulator|uniref:TetR/AcrR family transcriptional regulator n=1 Tax=Candidatus Merdisoma sp. JLR.KK006 TaxID=3112626 RepID=UPI002FEEBEDF|nr:TetR/AcrR family transcriptional regulator [Lachnospiraceae bacterium]
MADKTKKEDRRVKYTKQVIKESFLKLLEKNSFPKITVTELCRLAEINRGTFYLHYYDMDDVLDDLLSDMLSNTSSVMEHVLSEECSSSSCSYPFCDRIHSNDAFRPLLLDDTISGRIIDRMADHKEHYITWLMSHSILTFEEAEAVFYFQMNGCLTINKLMLRNHCSDWKKIQKVIDSFIRAGLESFLIHDQRDGARTD